MVVCAVVACRPQGVGQLGPMVVPPLPEYDFGKVPVLNQKTLELPITSASRAPVTLWEFALGKTDSAFRIVGTPPERLSNSGETVPLTVAFQPLLEQAYEDTLTFKSDDPDHALVEVKLTGEGSTRAMVEVLPTQLDFGVVGECATGVAQLTVESKGSADLVIEEIGLTADSAPGFAFVGSTRTPAVVKTTGANGLPGQLQLTVRYTAMPGVMGMPMGTVRLVTTDPDKREVLIPLRVTINQAPLPVIAPLGNGAPGLAVTLDGTGSSDPDGNTPLTYKWGLRSKPLASTTTIMSAEAVQASMRLDPLVPGAYEVQLEVTDAMGVKSCQPARATIVAAPAQKLLIELFWDNATTDLDLHLLRVPTAAVFDPPDDCHYQNPRPDWGVQGDATDDPELVRDALTGYGPEVFGYVNPIDTTYRAVVVFQNDLLSSAPASRATVRVYQYGLLKAEVSRSLPREGEIWSVLDVTWPSGEIRVLQ